MKMSVEFCCLVYLSGRGGWAGGWDSHGEYGDGYYEGLHSDCGRMRGRGEYK